MDAERRRWSPRRRARVESDDAFGGGAEAVLDALLLVLFIGDKG